MPRRGRRGPGARVPGPAAAQPAILGGTPVRTRPFPSWPVADALEERALDDVAAEREVGPRQRRTGRRGSSPRTPHSPAPRHCLATANGTSALLTVLRALDVGPGDEVIVPPYTFVATVNVVLSMHALPVFVDSDIETFQIDARKIDAAITPSDASRSCPVHLGGSAADLDAVLAAAAAQTCPVSRTPARRISPSGRAARSARYGSAGCFCFQASKNLNCGEGGAILTERWRAARSAAIAFHNNSRGRQAEGADFSYQRPRR